MELTLRDIVNALPFKFSKGDSEVLKNLMLKDDNEFLRFRGKDQFDKKVKALYPEINISELYGDFIYTYRKTSMIKRLCRDYENHGRENALLKFSFSESMDDDGNIIGNEFKILDNVVRPITDSFWNKYYPPNFAFDHCSVDMTFDFIDKITPIPENLPESNFEFNLYGLFISHIKPIEWPKSEIGSGVNWGINVKEIAFEASLEIFQKDGTIATDDDKEKIRKMIDDNIK